MADPNIIAFPDLKLAYIGICKAANTGIKRAFMEALGKTGDNPHDGRLFQYVGYEYIEARPDWLVFTVYRHPKTRFESCFRQKVWRPLGLHPGFKRKGYEPIYWKMPFADFLKFAARMPDEKSEQHFRGQAYDLFDKDDRPRFNLSARIEDMPNAWAGIQDHVKAHCGLELPKLRPKSNNSANIEAPVEWTPMLERIHRKRFERDFRLLGYD